MSKTASELLAKAAQRHEEEIASLKRQLETTQRDIAWLQEQARAMDDHHDWYCVQVDRIPGTLDTNWVYQCRAPGCMRIFALRENWRTQEQRFGGEHVVFDPIYAPEIPEGRRTWYLNSEDKP